jgi:hypothetical protein
MPRSIRIIPLALLTLPAAAHARQSAELDTSQMIMVRYDLAMARLAVAHHIATLRAARRLSL